MKSTAATLLILSVLSIAVFGFFMMQGENMHMFCAAALGGKSPCPADGLLALANYHLNILKNFSVAVFGNDLLLFIVFVALAVIVDFLSTIAAAALRKSAGSQGVAASSRLKLANLQTFSLRTKLNHWLSFHETSPTALARA